MRFFIDTANVAEIKKANQLGLVDGVTTNPSLIAKEGRDFHQIIEEICAIVNGPISVEAVNQETNAIVAEARTLAQISNNIVIKVPVTPDGLKATKILSAEGIAVNMTLVFSPTQAILVAKAGAAYVSPFIGRLDDISHIGMDLVRDIITIYDNYDWRTEVIVASIRNPLHVVDAALIGADIATIPFKVIEQLVRHPLTDVGIARFLADWKQVPQK